MNRKRKIAWTLGALLGLGLLGGAAAVRWNSPSPNEGDVPTVDVTRGTLEPKIYATGELRATNSTTLTAPQIGGGSLQITRLVRTGSHVKKDDVVIEFDPSEQEFKEEQNRSELEQADQEIIKAKADAAVQAANDKVSLLKARFDVRRAELEVGRNELVSAIDAKKNDLALEQAKRVLAQLEQDIKSHTVSSQATIGLAEEKRHKANLAMEQARQNMEKMKIRSTMDGIVAIEKNTSSDFFFGGMSLPDYHEGDQTNPGATIARVLDPAEMEITAQLDERERNNVRVGQKVEVRLDALPAQTFAGTVKTVGGMSAKNFWEDTQGGHFDVTVKVQGSDPRLRAGFTVQVVIAGDPHKDVLFVPKQAVFMKNGKRVVFVKNGTTFDEHDIKVTAETESHAAIEGVNAGTTIAFVDPTAAQKATTTSTSTTPMVGGAR
ncbi:MAG TPA: HlyD family efflux transporter periplasmic adaptor subunit [Terriglobales bacterium]|nr:HlyD family efflux transporter periplasmic adaptor subunit [Terriglobales bacterium]